jgi:hypothetical protein
MTELLNLRVGVRTRNDGAPCAVRIPGRGWRSIDRITNHWLVEADWWRDPVLRAYHRVLTDDGECYDLYRDLLDDGWYLCRRYD